MKARPADIVFDAVRILFLLLLVILTIVPFIHVLRLSFSAYAYSPETPLSREIDPPLTFSTINYEIFFSDGLFWQHTLNSVGRTVVAGLLHVLASALVAYTLSRREYVFRKPIAVLFFMSMYLEAGIVPLYFFVRRLDLLNTFTAYWITGLTVAWNIFIIRAYLKGLPEDCIEAARVEGAGDLAIFFRIIVPACMPVLVAVVFYTAVFQWNYWFDTFLYSSSNPDVSTLQYELARSRFPSFIAAPKFLRAAMVIILSLPVVFLSPLLQRFFVHGVNKRLVRHSTPY